jgi:hypothetical protein
MVSSFMEDYRWSSSLCAGRASLDQGGRVAAMGLETMVDGGSTVSYRGWGHHSLLRNLR